MNNTDPISVLSVTPVVEAVANQTSSTAIYVTLITAFLLYVSICSALRFRGRDALHKKLNYPTRDSLSKMTIEDAQAIAQYLGEYEFPYVYLTSLQFALFKTYGIPTISKILVETKQFSTPQNSSKRYADTIVIVDEIMGHPSSNERAMKSMARLNYLHGQYPQILNSDFLYTLAVILLEPIAWINEYEWRPLTQTEICGLATFWKDVGDRMHIKYHELKRFDAGWKDGIDFYEDIAAWTEAYESKNMVPARSNTVTGNETVSLLLCNMPHAVKPYATKAVNVVMGERVRIAMSYDPPTERHRTLVAYAFTARRFLLRYLSLPRPTIFRNRTLSEGPDPITGRYYYRNYQAHPFYVKPTFWNRWGPQALVVRLLGGIVPGGDHGDAYSPQGYVFSEVGPARTKGKGIERTDAFEKELRAAEPRCPFMKF